MTYYYINDCEGRYEHIGAFKNDGIVRNDFLFNKIELRIEHSNEGIHFSSE